MKKNILICICAIVLVLLSAGCGEKKQEEGINNNENVTTTTTTAKKNDSDDIIDDEIIDEDDYNNYEDPYACTKDKGANFELINCKNCVFTIFYDDRYYGSVVSEYTKDFKTLKDKYGCQRRRFLGFILDSSNKINKTRK